VQFSQLAEILKLFERLQVCNLSAQFGDLGAKFEQ